MNFVRSMPAPQLRQRSRDIESSNYSSKHRDKVNQSTLQALELFLVAHSGLASR